MARHFKISISVYPFKAHIHTCTSQILLAAGRWLPYMDTSGQLRRLWLDLPGAVRHLPHAVAVDAGLADAALKAVVDHAPQRATTVVTVRGMSEGGELKGVAITSHRGELCVSQGQEEKKDNYYRQIVDNITVYKISTVWDPTF